MRFSFSSRSWQMLCLGLLLVGCGSSDSDAPAASSTETGTSQNGSSGSTSSGAGSAGSGGGAGECAPSYTAETIHLAAGGEVKPAGESTVCLRWTAPEDIEVTSIVGALGPLGHHSLLFAEEHSTAPDGLAPCNDAEIMDAVGEDFYLLAGVSYESSGKSYDFPEYAGYQIGLRVAKGTQLVFDVHLLNATAEAGEGCAWLDLDRSKPVEVPLTFRTVLPEEEYELVVPAHDTMEIDVSEPAGSSFRVAAASSHMHAGATSFRMSLQPSDETLYETTNWAEPVPTQFDTKKVIVGEGDTLRLECSFENGTDADQHFPAQMCVGGLYVLSCSFPGAC